MDNFEKFVRDFLDDKVEFYLKSELVLDNIDVFVKVRERIMLKFLFWIFFLLRESRDMTVNILDIFFFVRL